MITAPATPVPAPRRKPQSASCRVTQAWDKRRIARRDQFTEDSRRRRQDIVRDVPRMHQQFPNGQRKEYENKGEAVLRARTRTRLTRITVQTE